MKILVACRSYPSPEVLNAMAFVHSRVIEYLRLGHEVDVLSFSSRNRYVFEGVQVFPSSDLHHVDAYDLVVAHAPNLQNHLLFLTRHARIPVVFVIHGHEFLFRGDYYPDPYDFQRSRMYPARAAAQRVYDHVKIALFRNFIERSVRRGRIVRLLFVSNWMRRQCLQCFHLPEPWVLANSTVVPNPVHRAFLTRHYSPVRVPDADVVCIRPFDCPKYAIDIVVEWARTNPDRLFHLFGSGRYFNARPPLPNVRVFQRFFPQAEIPALLDRYRAGAMPTRLDAQGVMMCEMASYGIPLLTSDLEVTREVLGAFPNVERIGPGQTANLRRLPPPLAEDAPVRWTFDSAGTVRAELAFFERSLSDAASALAKRAPSPGSGPIKPDG